MKKNVKGFISLFTGIAAFIVVGIALFVPTVPLMGTNILLYGSANVIIALAAALLGIAAMVFGIMSLSGKNTHKGPRKAGLIVGVCAILIAVGSAGFCGLVKTVCDYANGVPGNAISRMDDRTRRPVDEALKELELTPFVFR